MLTNVVSWIIWERSAPRGTCKGRFDNDILSGGWVAMSVLRSSVIVRCGWAWQHGTWEEATWWIMTKQGCDLERLLT